MRFGPSVHFLSLASATGLALLVSACGGGDDADLRIAVIGQARAPFETGPRLSTAGQLVRAATAQGLVGFDAQGRVVPALADRWIVTDDGLSYIFRLRDGTWPDGKPLTAESARAALEAGIAGLKGTSLEQDLAGLEDVRIMAGRVVEIRLSAANPDLLQLLAQPELGLGGAGPMMLARAGTDARLTSIPPKRMGLPEGAEGEDRVRGVTLAGLEAARAVDGFREGEVDMVLGGTFADFPLTAALGFSRGAVTPDPVIGLFGLSVTHAGGFLATPENREALAMAIDRDALAAALGVSGWALSSRIVPPGMEGDLGTIGERWTGLPLAARQAEAAARVARWRGGQGENPRLRVLLPAGKGADLLFARLSQDLATAGIGLVRVSSDGEADLRLIDAVARYPRASWFLGQLGCTRQRRGLCSQTADILAYQARSAPDQASRSALLAEAEAELTAANVYIPLGVPLRWSLVRGTVPGFAANRFAVHPLMSLAQLPR